VNPASGKGLREGTGGVRLPARRGRRLAARRARRIRTTAEARAQLERQLLDGVVRVPGGAERIRVHARVDRQTGVLRDVTVRPGDRPASLGHVLVRCDDGRRPVGRARLHRIHVVDHVPVADELIGIEVIRAAGVCAGEEVVPRGKRDDRVVRPAVFPARIGREGMRECRVALGPGVVGIPDQHFSGSREGVDRRSRGRGQITPPDPVEQDGVEALELRRGHRAGRNLSEVIGSQLRCAHGQSRNTGVAGVGSRPEAWHHRYVDARLSRSHGTAAASRNLKKHPRKHDCRYCGNEDPHLISPFH